MAPALRERTAIRAALAIDAQQAGRATAAALARRGIAADAIAVDQLSEVTGAVIAYAPAKPPTRSAAAALAVTCEAAARAGKPVVMLTAFAAAPAREARQRAAVLGFLRAAGAVLCADPDVWLETIVLIAGHGLPAGPRTALVTPPDSWLNAAANALAREWIEPELPAISGRLERSGPADVVLVDMAAVDGELPDHSGDALVVPIVGRSEHLPRDAARGRPALVGLRSAVRAAVNAGRLAQRLEAGLGRAAADDADFEVDEARFDRQLRRLGARAGDHETKVLLAAYDVGITRQAVATTPSAATRVAKKAGFPVQIKPWGPQIPSEPEGCPVEVDLHTAADVRRAYAAVAKRADLPAGAPVIVRETPPRGREASVALQRFGDLGWMLCLEVSGNPHPVAAPAPLTDHAAAELARMVEATRAGDEPPDQDALAELLRRVSHLVADYDDELDELLLHRVIINANGAVVVDASAALLR